MSAEGGALLTKAALAGGAGVLGALAIAAVKPPATRRELFLHALSAGIGSMCFGPLVLKLLAASFEILNPVTVEVAVPVYFVVGALSWGAFAALAELRALIARHGGKFAYRKVTGEQED